jgi:succinoglycan biosynthesis protein ExoL
MSIAYFAHELADAAVQRRIKMLRAAGKQVTLLGFERRRDGAASQDHGGRVLGRTRNGRFLARIASVLLAMPRGLRLRPVWRDAELVIARNLEMLALVIVLTRLSGARPRIAYECLDIHRLMLGDGPAGLLLRALERLCLDRVAVVITSSPAFERRYFRDRQRFAGPVLVAENKVLSTSASPPPVRAGGPPWVIAWCGVLRCARSLELLRAVAAANAGLVRVELWGAPALDQIPDFHAIVAASPHLDYKGRYKPEDLPAIYAAAHFAWAVDYYEAGGNSDWLLPNRLYESLCFGAPPIAAAGVETARWLERHGVGVVLDAPLERTLGDFLEALDADKYRALRDAAVGLDPKATRLTPEACVDFAAQLEGAAA